MEEQFSGVNGQSQSMQELILQNSYKLQYNFQDTLIVAYDGPRHLLNKEKSFLHHLQRVEQMSFTELHFLFQAVHSVLALKTEAELLSGSSPYLN